MSWKPVAGSFGLSCPHVAPQMLIGRLHRPAPCGATFVACCPECLESAGGDMARVRYTARKCYETAESSTPVSTGVLN
jgi:hypothetical protein